MIHKIITGVLAVLALLFGGSQIFGATSGPAHYQVESFLQGLTAGTRDQTTISNAGVVRIGLNGSSITELKATTCNFLGMNVAQAASSTKNYDCAVTGIASGDIVFVQIATTTNAQGEHLWVNGSGWQVRGCHASSTSGYATCEWHNMTGGSSVPSAVGNGRVGSSTNIFYIDN